LYDAQVPASHDDPEQQFSEYWLLPRLFTVNVLHCRPVVPEE
jgi:hypothetical protein